MFPRWLLTGALLAGLSACDDGAAGRGVPRLEASSGGRSAGTALVRLPKDGGPARLYGVPALAPLGWQSVDKVPAAAAALGADVDQRLVVLLDRAGTIATLDLETRRLRTLQRGVRAGGIGPDGTVYAVDTASAVTQYVRRRPIAFRAGLRGQPSALHGTHGGFLVAATPEGRDGGTLRVLAAEQPPVKLPLARGDLATTELGDLVGVATDSGVVLYETGGKRRVSLLEVRGLARAVAFTPSGHRILVGSDEDGIQVYDRYTLDRLATIETGGPVRAIRTDRLGRWILARPARADSVLVADIATSEVVAAVPAPWGDDLPTVAGAATLITRRGADVLAWQLGSASPRVTGTVEGGAADRWFAVAWQPPAPRVPAADSQPAIAARPDSAAGPAAADSATTPADSTAAPAEPVEVYLQVSASRNGAWARERVERLRAAGLPAKLQQPATDEEPYRVLVGPYPDRDTAEEARGRLDMPSFTVTLPRGAVP